MSARRVAPWVAPTSLAIAFVGLAVSVYLTIAHFMAPQFLVCSSGGIINCSKVTSSPQSKLFGIPVAFLGFAWFVVMTPLCTPRAWNTRRRAVHLFRLVLSVGGIGFVLWLFYAELFIIGSICEWCSVTHVMTLGLFVIIMTRSPDLLLPDDR